MGTQSDQMAEYVRLRKLISAIDKRIIVFEFIGENCVFPEKLKELLELNEAKAEEIQSDFGKFKEYFLEITSEIPSLEEDFIHGVGMIENDERYLIIHIFMGEEEAFGFVMDKTTEVNKRLKASKDFENIRRKAETDPLTGLANRNGFESIVRNYLEENGNNGALIIMDMDNFKLVNDMLGHPVGDKVLKQFASILVDYFNEEKSIVGRIGGDEFVVFLYDTMTREALGELLDRLIEKVKESFAEEYPQQKLSASVGAAFVEIGTNEYASLYKCADGALYQVKRTGKGNYVIN